MRGGGGSTAPGALFCVLFGVGEIGEVGATAARACGGRLLLFVKDFLELGLAPSKKLIEVRSFRFVPIILPAGVEEVWVLANVISGVLVLEPSLELRVFLF